MISWIDDIIILGQSDLVMQLKKDLMQQFDCDDCGHLEEFVGKKMSMLAMTPFNLFRQYSCKATAMKHWLGKRRYNAPAQPGTLLMKPLKDSNQLLNSKDQLKIRSRIGKLLWHMQYSRPDYLQAVRDLARHMTRGNKSHMVAMLQCMQYLKCTKDTGLFLKPERKEMGVTVCNSRSTEGLIRIMVRTHRQDGASHAMLFMSKMLQ
jgi:hypothetical protein